MRGVSAASQTAVVDRLDDLLGQEGTDPEQVGSDLFGVTALLEAEPRLRRAVTDPATPADAKSGLLHGIVGGQVSDAAAQVAVEASRHRWAASTDLLDALEYAGVSAQVQAAVSAGQADELKDELFRFGRLVVADPALRDALADRSAPVDGKRELVRSLLQGKATSPTVRLVEQAVAGRYRSFTVALEQIQSMAAQRQQRLVATVRAARPLQDDERRRLAGALTRQYGRDVHLNLVSEPALLGGLRIEVGDDVIDGTVRNRLDNARRLLAG